MLEKGIIEKSIVLPVTILLAAIILGGFYYATQANKQQSIEKQKQLEIDAERRKEEKEEVARKECYSYAQESAENLLKTKSEMDSSNSVWKEAAEKELYLKDDFDKYYEDCLSSAGLKR